MSGYSLFALLAALPGAALIFTLVPLLLRAKWTERASCRLVATSELVILLGWAVMPVMVSFCFGEAIASWTGASRMAGGPCWFGMDASSWRVLGDVLAFMALVPLTVSLWRLGLSARRSELTGPLARVVGVFQTPSGGKAFVLPTSEVAAYAGGVLRPRAIVTKGLMDPLSHEEKEAVCEHELAHIRLGHPRVLLLATAIYRTYRFLPPVQWAYEGLRRAMEVSADEEAAKWVGTSSLISALARVAIIQAGDFLARSVDSLPWMASEARFGDKDHIRYRLRQLRSSASRPSRLANVGLASVIAGSVAILTLSSCTFFDPSFGLSSLLACTILALAVACRPAWEASWGKPTRQRASGYQAG
jgi:Zn-dependent protease with chaperone function